MDGLLVPMHIPLKFSKMTYDKPFVPLLSDEAFKAVYGKPQNKGVLIDLLNEILPEHARIDDIVEYCDREQQADTVESKRSSLDLICKGLDGSHFIVEVQRKFYKDYFERLVFYGAGVYHLHLNAGEEYYNLKPVYVISILDHVLRHEDKSLWDTDNMIARYEFMEIRTKEIARSTISIIFAEMPRFTKTFEECTTYRDQLFWWLNNCDKMDDVPQEIRNSKLKDTIVASEFASFGQKEQLELKNRIMNEFDRKRELYWEREEGREEGRKEGERSKALEVAKNLMQLGIPVSQISLATGLSAEVVAAL